MNEVNTYFFSHNCSNINIRYLYIFLQNFKSMLAHLICNFDTPTCNI